MTFYLSLLCNAQCDLIQISMPHLKDPGWSMSLVCDSSWNLTEHIKCSRMTRSRIDSLCALEKWVHNGNTNRLVLEIVICHLLSINMLIELLNLELANRHAMVHFLFFLAMFFLVHKAYCSISELSTEVQCSSFTSDLLSKFSFYCFDSGKSQASTWVDVLKLFNSLIF